MKKTALLIVLILALLITGAAAGQGLPDLGSRPTKNLAELPDPGKFLDGGGTLLDRNYSYNGILYETYLYPAPESEGDFITRYFMAASGAGFETEMDFVDGNKALKVYSAGKTGDPALILYDYNGYLMLMVPNGMNFLPGGVQVQNELPYVAPPATATSEPTPTKTFIPPTATPLPTATPKPTSTPKPVSTPTPVPTVGLRVGERVFFGRYEQDNNLHNGQEEIEWQVLSVERDRALLISRYILDSKWYQGNRNGVTWENSYIRNWLNGTFYNSAFTSSEQRSILEVSNSNPDNPQFAAGRGGNSTRDRIFLLSIDEANRYFYSDRDRQCLLTDYARVNGGPYSVDSTGYAWWWLRSPGQNVVSAADVFPSGRINAEGYWTDDKTIGVRPAFWLDL